MAFLNARQAVLELMVVLAWASFATQASAGSGMVQGIDVEGRGSFGPGSLYGAGGSFTVELGDDEDEDNLSGDIHANYLNELSPQDPNVDGGPLKAISNWSGGAAIKLGRGWSLGLDFESIQDPFEQVNTSGIKGSLGLEPWTLSFRHSRNAINQSFSVPTGVTFQGAFIYQEMLKLEGDFKVSQSNSLKPSVSGSLFSPDANAFATLLSKQIFSSLSNFQDTLTSFELWSLGLSWNHEFSKEVQTEISATYGYLVIGAGTSLETEVGVSFPIIGLTTGKLGWQYTYDPSSHSNMLVFELQTRWEP